jgi:hypothetical protein
VLDIVASLNYALKLVWVSIFVNLVLLRCIEVAKANTWRAENKTNLKCLKEQINENN